MRTWTKEKAEAYLRKQGVGINGTMLGINKNRGLGGLKACSACDFLVNHHNYVVLRVEAESDEYM